MLVTRPVDGTGTYQDLSGRHFLERRLEANVQAVFCVGPYLKVASNLNSTVPIAKPTSIPEADTV